MAQGFYQRRNDLMDHILSCSDLTITQKCIGMKLLIGYMNSQSEHAWMSTSRLAKDLNVDKETVRRALKALVKLGFLERTRRPGQTSVYGMGAAYRYVAYRRQERRPPPAREPRDPRHQSGPNLMNEPKYNPFAETRRKRDAGGLRRLSYDEMIRDLDADQGSPDYEQLGPELSGGDGGD